MPRAACFLGLAVGLMAIAFIATGTASGRNLQTTVDCDSDDLQASIDAAPTDATIHVRGTCIGNFRIARDIELRGLGSATLQGDGGTVVTIAEGAEVVLTDIIVTGGSANLSLPYELRVSGVYNAGFLTLDGKTSVSKNVDFHCDPGPQEGFCAPNWPSVFQNRIGGVVNSGRLLMTDRSSVQDNYGSGIWNFGRIELRRWASVARNTTLEGGGGIRNEGFADMHDFTSVKGNGAIFRGSFGGGVHNVGTFAMHDRSSIVENVSRQSGGGIYTRGMLTLNDRASIQDNFSDFRGGGIYGDVGLVILNGRYSIMGNEAWDAGGGIFWSTDAIINGALDGVVHNMPDDCYSEEFVGPCPQ